jgi:hypothetical protein
MTKIGDVAQRYLDAVTKMGFGIAPRLAPGIGREEVQNRLDSVGLKASDAVIDWFGWRNGIKDNPEYLLGQMWLMPLFYPCSIEHANAHFRLGLDSGFFWFFPSGGACRLLLPISDGVVLGDQGVFDCDYEFWPAPVKRFDSILSMLRTLAEAAEAGAIFLDADGDSLDKDYDRFREIARRLNPHSDFSDERG